MSKRNFGELDQFKFLIINTPSLWKQGKSRGDLEFIDNSVYDSDSYYVSINDSNHLHDDYNNNQNGNRSKGINEGIRLAKYQEFFRRNEFQMPVENPIDLALDHNCNIIYILEGDAKKLSIYDLNKGYLDYIQCVRFHDPRAIDVGKSDIYLLDGNEVIVLAKVNFQIRRRFSDIGENAIAMTLDEKEENILVLDSQGKQIYKISTINGKVNHMLKTDEGKNAISGTSAICVGKRDGKIYILNSQSKQVIIVVPYGSSTGTEQVHTISLNGSEQFSPSGLAALDEENIFVGDKGGSGQDYFPHPRKFSSSKSGSSVRTLGYGRSSDKIILSKNGDCLFVINFGDGWIIKFTLEDRFASYGSYISYPLDSGIPGLQWHKFQLDQVIPDTVNNMVEVAYCATESDDHEPAEGQWIKSKLPNPRDSLMFDTVGRYLWFKIELFSKNSINTPTVRCIKAYLPRMSYLRYLPAVYQENNTSKEFLERFLSLFETFFTQIDEFNFTKYIDPKATPDGFLPWLGSWLALGYDANWPQKNFRKLIEKAPQLYKMRGTRRGIEQILRIYLANQSELENDEKMEDDELQDSSAGDGTEVKVDPGLPQECTGSALAPAYKFMIFENFQLDLVKNDNDYSKLFCGDPFSFCILLNPHMVDEIKAQVVKRIVENEKPAHTVGKVVLLQSWFYLGMHTYLGINTQLGEPRFLVGMSGISRDSVIGRGDESSNQIELSSRIGIDTHIS